MKNKLIATEDQEQAALFQWADTQPHIRDYLFAIPNGGYRHKATAARLKKTGVKAGVPDIFLAIPTISFVENRIAVLTLTSPNSMDMDLKTKKGGEKGIFSGLFIELKRREKSKISSKQQEMMHLLAMRGYVVEVCYGWEEAKDAIRDYLKWGLHV